MSERIGVELSDNALRAMLTIREGAPADLAAIETILTEKGIIEGIEWARLARVGEALSDPTFTLDQVIAEGAHPVPGADGEILLAVTDRTQPGQARPDGSLDYRERHTLTSVSAGELLAEIRPATKGKTGITVTGKALPAKDGAELRLALGPGIDRQGPELLALADGVLSYVPGERIDVVRHIDHKADVDYASGNLDVNGSIIVAGDVHPGFSVVASDDVIIKGSVSTGTVCAGNSIRIGGGAIGKGTALLAGSSLYCRHALEATLRAGETITFGDHSMNCLLTAGKVCAENGRGVIVGGEIRARSSISLREAGSGGSIKTILAVAVATSEQGNLIRLRQDSRRAERREQKRGRSRGHSPKGGKPARAAMQRLARMADMQNKVVQEQKRLLAEARIQISGTAHVGVCIRFAEHELLVEDPLQAPVFLFDQESKTVIMEES